MTGKYADALIGRGGLSIVVSRAHSRNVWPNPWTAFLIYTLSFTITSVVNLWKSSTQINRQQPNILNCNYTIFRLACEQQTHFRSSLLSLQGEKRRPEMRLLFAGYFPICLTCENIRFSSLFAAGGVSRGGTRETSTAARGEEKRMFSQPSICCYEKFEYN